jgi:hypothetical protein
MGEGSVDDVGGVVVLESRREDTVEEPALLAGVPTVASLLKLLALFLGDNDDVAVSEALLSLREYFSSSSPPSRGIPASRFSLSSR